MTPEQRAEQIRTLVKEWLQRGDDRMPEELKQLIEHPIYAKRLQVRKLNQPRCRRPGLFNSTRAQKAGCA